MLVSSAELPVGAIYQLRIDLPKSERKTQVLELGGEILWSEKSSEPGKHWLGIQIIDVSHEMTARIQDWINHEESGK